jgi:hypothetical protein
LKQKIKDEQFFYASLNLPVTNDMRAMLQFVRRSQEILKERSVDVYNKMKACSQKRICVSDDKCFDKIFCPKYKNEHFENNFTKHKGDLDKYSLFTGKIPQHKKKYDLLTETEKKEQTSELNRILNELNEIRNTRIELVNLIPKSIDEYNKKCSGDKIDAFKRLEKELRKYNKWEDRKLYNGIHDAYESIYKDCTDFDDRITNCETEETDRFFREDEMLNKKYFDKNGNYEYFDPFRKN